MASRATIHARVNRMELAHDGQGSYLLAFSAPRAPVTFELARQALADLPLSERRYIPDMRCWLVSHAAILALAGRWPLLAEALALLDGEGGREDEQPAHVPAKIGDAFAALCLTPGAPVGLIETARRYYAKQYHPDVAGASADLARMQRINAAADVAEQYARERPPSQAGGPHAA